MLGIFTSTMFFFNRPIDHQSTGNDRLKPVITTGLDNMHIDGSIANLATLANSMDPDQLAFLVNSVDPDQLASEMAS